MYYVYLAFAFCTVPFLTIIIHESGHFFFMKLFGLTLKEFSVGKGQLLFRFGRLSFRKEVGKGYCEAVESLQNNLNKIQLFFVYAGGVIATGITGCFVIAGFTLLYIRNGEFLSFHGYLLFMMTYLISDVFVNLRRIEGRDGYFLYNIVRGKKG
ncbi:site-2 protease family protein [Bacillus sp. NPDC094106]|uniref:site-2 protease family protein n=1 Tax=Bacillus sp. NPDC094106 TaxID=3363949 RepID=UPI0038191397